MKSVAERVAIHDGARCLLNQDVLSRTIEACSEGWAGAIAALPVRDTLKRTHGDQIKDTIDRNNVWGMQTPQVFHYSFIQAAYEKAHKDGFRATDDAQIAEYVGGRVRVVEADSQNMKITFPADAALASAILEARDK